MRFTVALLLLTGCLSAQVPVACGGQLPPLKPIGMTCSNAVASCVTDSAGRRGAWVWGCPESANEASGVNSSGMNPTVFLGRQTPMPDLTEQRRKKAEVALLEAQAEALRLETERLKYERANPTQKPQPIPEHPPEHVSLPPSPAPGSTLRGDDVLNGRGWAADDRSSKVSFVMGYRNALAMAVYLFKATPGKYPEASEKYTHGEVVNAIDLLYTDPANILIPYRDIAIVALWRLAGATPEAVEANLANWRKLANGPTGSPTPTPELPNF